MNDSDSKQLPSPPQKQPPVRAADAELSWAQRVLLCLVCAAITSMMFNFGAVKWLIIPILTFFGAGR